MRVSNTKSIVYGIFGEGSQSSTDHKRENSAFLLYIGLILGNIPENTVLYKLQNPHENSTCANHLLASYARKSQNKPMIENHDQ